MVEITEAYKEMINKPGRIGTLSTADGSGRPNVGYFGSPRVHDDGTRAVDRNRRSLRDSSQHLHNSGLVEKRKVFRKVHDIGLFLDVSFARVAVEIIVHQHIEHTDEQPEHDAGQYVGED